MKLDTGKVAPGFKSFSPGVAVSVVEGVKPIHLTLLDGVSSFPVNLLISVKVDSGDGVPKVKSFSPGGVISDVKLGFTIHLTLLDGVSSFS